MLMVEVKMKMVCSNNDGKVTTLTSVPESCCHGGYVIWYCNPFLEK